MKQLPFKDLLERSFARTTQFICLAVLLSTSASAQPWSLPQTLNDTNFDAAFTVDSTWVLVEGTTHGITGEVRADPKDPAHVITELHVPVSEMKTGFGPRDEKLQYIMAQDKFPTIDITVTSLDTSCTPAILDSGKTCDIKQSGTVMIRGVTREVTLTSHLSDGGSSYLATGAIIFPWAAFNIPDPSILVAKLAPDVTVTYSADIAK